jgi:hypothetical protein
MFTKQKILKSAALIKCYFWTLIGEKLIKLVFINQYKIFLYKWVK